MAVSDSEALAAVLAVAGAEFDGLAGNLESARNVLISGLGTAMHSAKEAALAQRWLEAIVQARRFADATATLLVLKFLPNFQYLEDITQSGPYQEPMSLGMRIHEYLTQTKVPPSVLNALEELRVLGNRAVFVYADPEVVGPKDVNKVLLLLQLIGRYVVRGGSVGSKLMLSARPGGKRGPPPGLEGTYVADPNRPLEMQQQPLSTEEIGDVLLAMSQEEQILAEQQRAEQAQLELAAVLAEQADFDAQLAQERTRAQQLAEQLATAQSLLRQQQQQQPSEQAAEPMPKEQRKTQNAKPHGPSPAATNASLPGRARDKGSRIPAHTTPSPGQQRSRLPAPGKRQSKAHGKREPAAIAKARAKAQADPGTSSTTSGDPRQFRGPGGLVKPAAAPAAGTQGADVATASLPAGVPISSRLRLLTIDQGGGFQMHHSTLQENVQLAGMNRNTAPHGRHAVATGKSISESIP
ncbi:uncharacterized protein MONBRDRAFT_23614 [Monosiga brevicollis MX1]|uniref:Uncharacterized protein n=1 Tax=Monosiga brevicollis TaxID=81824 RepID=A9UTZ1_MONBE|nr:uncharacterized protein MONBRDRAFT_23614 [Monosiga brevicollis MX1]EDQ91577.1 predicted protein [Monosiga brevicollis MX1]|eukprot:XP_001743999.1 hypothetical protein [Monosiga brevicollis MX1]